MIKQLTDWRLPAGPIHTRRRSGDIDTPGPSQTCNRAEAMNFAAYIPENVTMYKVADIGIRYN